MSIKVMELAWYVSGLRPAQKAVLVALADHANDNGRDAYPSVARLVLKTSYAERTVRRALSDLREMELISVEAEAHYHSQTVYSLDLTEMQARQERPARNDTRPARDAAHDLPETTQDLPESTDRPARGSAKPSYNHPSNHPSEPRESEAPATSPNGFWEIPKALDTLNFLRAWKRWFDYVDERRLDFTETQAELTLQELAEHGETTAINSITESIRRGWRNIYVNKGGKETAANGNKPEDGIYQGDNIAFGEEQWKEWEREAQAHSSA